MRSRIMYIIESRGTKWSHVLRPTCLLGHLYELATSATRFSQEFVDGINLGVRIALQANVGSKVLRS